MTQQIDNFSTTGLGTPALADDIRNQYAPVHGNANLPDDAVMAAREEEAELDVPTTRVVDIVAAEVEPTDSNTDLRNKIAVLEAELQARTIECQMFRRFHGSKDDKDQQLFMQATIFLANTALEYKLDEDRMQEFFNGKGECLHPEESIKDTGFGVYVCTECKKHVEPVTEAPCPHEETITYGTVGMKQCLQCGTNLPRDHFTRVEDDQVALVNAVGVSIPKGQPTLNPGLAPRGLR